MTHESARLMNESNGRWLASLTAHVRKELRLTVEEPIHQPCRQRSAGVKLETHRPLCVVSIRPHLVDTVARRSHRCGPVTTKQIVSVHTPQQCAHGRGPVQVNCKQSVKSLRPQPRWIACTLTAQSAVDRVCTYFCGCDFRFTAHCTIRTRPPLSLASQRIAKRFSRAASGQG